MDNVQLLSGDRFADRLRRGCAAARGCGVVRDGRFVHIILCDGVAGGTGDCGARGEGGVGVAAIEGSGVDQCIGDGELGGSELGRAAVGDDVGKLDDLSNLIVGRWGGDDVQR